MKYLALATLLLASTVMAQTPCPGVALNVPCEVPKLSYPCPGPACGPVHFAKTQTPAPNPFVSKAKSVEEPYVTAIYAKGGIWGRVIIGDTTYAVASSDGPKTSGMYEARFVKMGANQDIDAVQFYVYHMNVRASETYTMKIFSAITAASPAQYVSNLVDYRRLLVYGVSSDRILALAIDRTTNTTTHYVLHPTGKEPLAMGIYDFMITQEKDKSFTLSIYRPHIIKTNQYVEIIPTTIQLSGTEPSGE